MTITGAYNDGMVEAARTKRLTLIEQVGFVENFLDSPQPLTATTPLGFSGTTDECKAIKCRMAILETRMDEMVHSLDSISLAQLAAVYDEYESIEQEFDSRLLGRGPND